MTEMSKKPATKAESDAQVLVAQSSPSDENESEGVALRKKIKITKEIEV